MAVTGTNISLTLRQVKGSELTHKELDDNQSNLKTGVESHSHDEFAPALGADDNYVTDAEKTKLSNLSGTNTGDQDLSGLLNETSHDLLDHTGLTGIPTQYTLPTASTDTLGGVKVDGTTVTITDGVISSTATGGVTDHGALSGLSDDDHSQYLNETRHNALDHTGLTGIPTQYTDEMAQDAVGAAIAAGTQTGITVAYDDANNKINFTVTASGAGDVTGPASSTDNHVVFFDGATGKVIKDSGLTLSGSNTGDQDLSGYATTASLGTAAYTDSTAYDIAGAASTVQSNLDIHKTSSDHDGRYYTETEADAKLAGKENYHGVQSAGALSFDNSTHVLTIASGSNIYWYQGIKYETTSAITCDLDSYVTLTTDAAYFVYFDDASGTLKASVSFWNLATKVPVAIVMWNGAAGAIGYECHNHTRDIDWHKNAHLTIGTRYQSGLVQTYPSTTVDNQISISSGTIWDEDIQLSIGASTFARLWYQTATGYHFETTPVTVPYKLNGSQIQYMDSDTWTLTDIASNRYGVTWVYATSDTAYPIYLLVGTSADVYASVSAALDAPVPNLSATPFNPEAKLLFKWVFSGDGQYQTGVDYRQSSTIPAGGAAAISAAAVTFSPVGNIGSGSVQGAVEELDAEKEAVGVAAGLVSTHESTYDHTKLHDPVTISDSTSIDLTLTGQQISAAAIFGTTSGTVAEGNHTHTGVYEPADATILKDADIGVTVQAYDADLTSWAAIAPSAKQDTLVSGTNIKTINNTSILGAGNLIVSGGMTSIPVNWTSPTVITDTANLTYGSYNIVSVTAADKILTLPEITSSDYGKFVVVEIAASTTKLITIDGYSTQTIDGATTRIMWASEVAQLVATASGWTKVGGKSIPVYSGIERQSGQSFIANAWTKILTNSALGTNLSSTQNTSDSKLIVPRAGLYNIGVGVWTNNNNATATTWQMATYKGPLGGSSSGAVIGVFYAPANTYMGTYQTFDLALAAGDFLELYAFFGAGSYNTTCIFAVSGVNHIKLREVATW